MDLAVGRRVRGSLRSFDHLRPGARALVLSVALAIVLTASYVTAEAVSDHVTRTATDQAVAGAETIVRGYVEPLLTPGAMNAPSSVQADDVNAELERLVGGGQLLRIKVWAPDGTVRFSDLAVLRGARFEPGEELEEALGGETATELTAPDAAENVYERGLADKVLEIYLPIRDPADGRVTGAYEVYEDAAPILAAVAAARRDVFLVAIVMAGLIVLLLYLAFAGTWARLVRTNRSLRRLAGEVRRSEGRFRSLVQNAGDVFAVLDRRGRLLYTSVAVRRVLGHRADALARDSLLRLVHPDDAEWAARLFGEVLLGPGSQRTGETRVRHADGSWRAMEWTLTNLLGDQAVRGIVLNARDVSERRELEEQLRHQALHDPLTGLANRALLVDRLEHALARRPGRDRGLAVLFLDLDDFKTINDSLGHGVGDRLLVAVAERLRAVVRPGDTVARMGGDEFAIVLEDAAADDPVATEDPGRVAQQLLDVLREPVRIASRTVSVSASVGIAWSDRARRRAADLLRDADIAMYAAKRRGKARYEIFESGMRAAAVARLEVKSELDRALARDELRLRYQPIVDLGDGRIDGFEALVRWEHPQRGLLTPEWFIPVAEETGQIVGLGRWVVAEACRQTAAWQRGSIGQVRMAVNVSARELREPGFVGHLRDALEANDLAPGALTVEITETTWVEEVETSSEALGGLRALGVHLAIDDFGIGYSSLGYLRRLPFEAIKIDRSFLAGMVEGGTGEQLVRSIVEIAERLDRIVIAEGIEDADQLAALRRIGCRLGQGNLFARPVDGLVAGELLQAGAVALPRTNGRRSRVASARASMAGELAAAVPIVPGQS